MKIENTSTNFQRSRLKYQKFDHIIRNSNNQCPKVSPTRIQMRLKQCVVTARYYEWIEELKELVNENRERATSNNFINIIENDVENVKRYKLGDCGESSAIIIAALIANGINNFKIGHLLFDVKTKDENNKLITKHTYNTTHEFVALNVDKNYDTNEPKTYGKNLIILDSWAGFCGNLSKAFQEFYQLFNNGIRKIKNDGTELFYKPKIRFYDLKINVTEEMTKKFAKKFPELVIKGNK